MKYLLSTVFILVFITAGYSQNPCPGIPTVDYAGKTYHTVAIGNQCWLVENLNVGNQINGLFEQTNNDTIQKYCYGDISANCDTFGGLYQWAEAMNYQNGAINSAVPVLHVQGICPTGWHLPDTTEFIALANAVNNNGNSLKAIGEGTGSGAGSNTSGFAALLAGTRFSDGSFGLLHQFNFFVSSTEGTVGNAYFLDLSGQDSIIFLGSNSKAYGRSVRCLSDAGVVTTCPRSQGYWKNHPDNWPNVMPLMLGTLNTYSKSNLITILKTPVRGDASIILAYQLIAAKLNVANYAILPLEVKDAIINSDAAIGTLLIPAGVRPNSTLGHTMTSLAEILDHYNNGLLTPGCQLLPIKEAAPMKLDLEPGVRSSYELLGNFPNPFNPTTKISFILPENNQVTLKIYNSTGQLVRTLVNEKLNQGYHTLEWNATNDNGNNLPSGIYLYRLQAGKFVQTSKMILMK
jgi:uncharacterized protein (TIGR02145 family)